MPKERSQEQEELLKSLAQRFSSDTPMETPRVLQTEQTSVQQTSSNFANTQRQSYFQTKAMEMSSARQKALDDFFGIASKATDTPEYQKSKEFQSDTNTVETNLEKQGVEKQDLDFMKVTSNVELGNPIQQSTPAQSTPIQSTVSQAGQGVETPLSQANTTQTNTMDQMNKNIDAIISKYDLDDKMPDFSANLNNISNGNANASTNADNANASSVSTNPSVDAGVSSTVAGVESNPIPNVETPKVDIPSGVGVDPQVGVNFAEPNPVKSEVKNPQTAKINTNTSILQLAKMREDLAKNPLGIEEKSLEDQDTQAKIQIPLEDEDNPVKSKIDKLYEKYDSNGSNYEYSNIHNDQEDEESDKYLKVKNPVSLVYMFGVMIEIAILILIGLFVYLNLKDPNMIRFFSFEKQVSEKETRNLIAQNDREIGQITIPALQNRKVAVRISTKTNLVNGAVILDTNQDQKLDPKTQNVVIAGRLSDDIFAGIEDLKKGAKLELVFDNDNYEYKVESVKEMEKENLPKFETDTDKPQLIIITDGNEEGTRILLRANLVK